MRLRLAFLSVFRAVFLRLQCVVNIVLRDSLQIFRSAVCVFGASGRVQNVQNSFCVYAVFFRMKYPAPIAAFIPCFSGSIFAADLLCFCRVSAA